MSGESSNSGDSKAFGLRPSTAQLMLRLASMMTGDGALPVYVVLFTGLLLHQQLPSMTHSVPL